MKTGDYQQGAFAFDNKKRRVWKPLPESSSYVAEDNGKLSGVRPRAVGKSVNRCAKTPPRSRSFGFVPVLRFDQCPPRGRSENNRERWGNAV